MAELRKSSVLGIDNLTLGDACSNILASAGAYNSVEDTLAMKKQHEELAEDRKLVDKLMDPSNNLENMKRDDFAALL